jgi:hypothetical protein
MCLAPGYIFSLRRVFDSIGTSTFQMFLHSAQCVLFSMHSCVVGKIHIFVYKVCSESNVQSITTLIWYKLERHRKNKYFGDSDSLYGSF